MCGSRAKDGGLDKEYYLYVRCVRGGQLDFGNFQDNLNGTVTDNSTGLMWQQGEPGSMTWDSALSYCEGRSLGGHSDWRLPNIKELGSITDDTRANPAIDTAFFPNAYMSSYWSSTTFASNPSGAWDVDFDNGDVHDGYYKYSDRYVRCVRGGQSGSFGNLEVSPSSHNFGEVLVGNSSTPQTFTFSNTGTGDLNISGMTLSDTTNYSLNINGGSSPCGSTTPTIAPNNSCTVTVTFSPFAIGTIDTTFTINSDDPDTSTLNVSLSGIGVEQTPIIEKILGVKEPGHAVRIIGQNFGDSQGDSVVHIGPRIFDSSSPSIRLWSDTKIRIRLPSYQCGWFNKDPHFRYIKVWVTVDGVDSNKKRLKVMKPSTCPSGGGSCTSCHS